MNARKRAVFRADVAVRRALVLYRRGESKAGVLRTDSAPLPLSPSQKAKLEKLGREYLAELRKRGDAGWEDVERDKGGKWSGGGAAAQVKGPALDYLRKRLADGAEKVVYPLKVGGQRYLMEFSPHSLEGTDVLRDYPSVTVSVEGRTVAEALFARRGGEPTPEGLLDMSKGRLIGHDVRVAPEHRRLGLATAMYAFASKLTGENIAPGDIQTEEGAAFRAAWGKAHGDTAWEDVPRDKGGKWAAGHGLPQGMNAAHKAQHSKLVKSGKHEEAKAYRSKFGGAPASTPAAQPAERFASIVRPYAESAGRGESFVKAAVARKESIRGDFEKLIGGVQGKAFKFAHQDAQRSDWNEEEFLRIPAGQPGAGQFSGGGERHTEQNPPPSLSAGVKAGLTKKENKAAAATAAALTSPEITKWKASLAENHQLAAKATDPEEQKIWHEKVIPNAEKHLALAIAAEKAKQEVQPPSDLQAAPFEPLKPEETGELRQPHQPPQIHLLHEQTSTAQAPSGASKPSLNPETGQPWEVLSATQPPPSPTPSIPEPTAHEPEAQSAPAPEPTSANPSGMKAAHKAQYTKLVKSGQHEKAAAYLTKYGGQQAHTPASEAPKPSGPALQVEHLPVTRADLFTHLGGVDAVVHHEAENAAAVTWRNKLTHVFRVALGLYQGTGYRLWNKALRKKSLTDLDHAEKIRHLQAALDTAPALEKNVTVWRGFEAEGGIAKLATDPAAFLAKMGNVFHDNAFVSTSIHLGKAINFAGQTKSSAVVMRIRVPAGTKTPYLTHSQGGAYEYEHLLQRDSDFKIDRIYKTSDGYTVLDGHYLGSTPAGLSQRGHHKDAKDDPGNLTERDAKYVWQDGDITFRHEE